MVNRHFQIVTIVTAMLCATTARSEDGTLPKNMLGFLEPGMRVGIHTVDGTTNVLLNVYSDEQYNVARDLTALDGRIAPAKKFADDHPVLRKKLDGFVTELIKKSPDANVSQVFVYPLSRTSFGSIAAIGEDYVLIDREGESNRRLVLSKLSISRIDLNAESARFADTSIR